MSLETFKSTLQHIASAAPCKDALCVTLLTPDQQSEFTELFTELRKLDPTLPGLAIGEAHSFVVGDEPYLGVMLADRQLWRTTSSSLLGIILQNVTTGDGSALVYHEDLIEELRAHVEEERAKQTIIIGLHTHKVSPLNHLLAVSATDPLSEHGHSRYSITGADFSCHPKWVEPSDHQMTVLFNEGEALNGVTEEALLAILIHRLQSVQGTHPTRQRSLAITKLEEALMWLDNMGREQHGGASANPFGVPPQMLSALQAMGLPMPQ